MHIIINVVKSDTESVMERIDLNDSFDQYTAWSVYLMVLGCLVQGEIR